MYVLTPQNLVKEDLDVVRTEMLWTDNNLVKIALQQFCYYISKCKICVKENFLINLMIFIAN